MEPPQRPASGQASLEYVGACAVLAAVLTIAFALAGRPPLAEAIAQKIRHGLCIVTDGVCTSDDARAAGLLPCTLSEQASGEDNGVTFAVLRVGGRHDWVLARRSDGSVAIHHSDETDIGAGGEVDLFGLPLGGSLDGGAHEAWTWEFPDMAAAQRFVAMIRTPEGRRNRPLPTYTYRSLAARGQGAVPGGNAVDGTLAIGRRTGRGLTTTFLSARVGDPGPFARLPGLEDAARLERIVVEHSEDRAGPREIAFLLEAAGERPGTRIRVRGRLDLRNGANRDVAGALLRLRTPWPPSVVAGLRATVDRTLKTGTVEAELLAVRSTEKGFDHSLPFVKALGVRHVERLREARLLAARAWVAGVPRDREDCLRPDTRTLRAGA